jgi:RNA polymerase II subunit A small phosphatase-like protein
VLIVEDTPENVQRHYDNAIFVSSWTGESNDNELVLLEQYLASVHGVPNVRKLEKREWRQAHPVP